jgi:hypothetical protein
MKPAFPAFPLIGRRIAGLCGLLPVGAVMGYLTLPAAAAEFQVRLDGERHTATFRYDDMLWSVQEGGEGLGVEFRCKPDAAGCDSSFVVTVMYRPRLHGCRLAGVAGAKRPHDLLHNIRYTLGMKFTDGRGNRPFLGSLKPSFGGELHETTVFSEAMATRNLIVRQDGGTTDYFTVMENPQACNHEAILVSSSRPLDPAAQRLVKGLLGSPDVRRLERSEQLSY